MAPVRRTFPAAVRFALATALVAVAAFQPGRPAGAVTQQQVDAARAHVKQLLAQVEAERAQLGKLGTQFAAVNEQVLQAKDVYDQDESELLKIQQDLSAAKSRYQTIVTRLAERARQAYMTGPGSSLAFVLGASSLTDLSDRVEFIDAVARNDADLAQEVQNTKNLLAAAEAKQRKLADAAQAAYLDYKQKLAEVQANFEQQQQILANIKAKKRQAIAYANKVSSQYQRELRASLGVGPSSGLLKYCPVDPPRAFGDGFGAPRFAGGYHLHEGVDILAPMGTPIRAPFDGNAVSDYNALGGDAVFVYGSLGYVYNAHLSSYGTLGHVSAGTIIGYVGDTGDAQGGPTHDHFEWHPNVVPSDWPKSAYGYSVIGSAVNPYPLLVAACS